MYRAVHYLNQFFAGFGAEESAGLPPGSQEGPLGPGRLLQNLLGEDIRIVATVYCGDNHFAENEGAATREIIRLIVGNKADFFFAGPAFAAGRYGFACDALCRAVSSELKISVLTAMSASNPAADTARRKVNVVSTGHSARDMAPTLEKVASIIKRTLDGEALSPLEREGILPHGTRMNAWKDQTAAERAIDMLLAKLANRPFETEIPLPGLEPVPRASGVKDLRKARVALVTTTGIVPHGNPDGIRSYHSTQFGAYSIAGMDELSGGVFESVHGGFLTAPANEDPDRVLPVDILRELVREGGLGGLHDTFYSTTGNGTPPEDARKIGREMAEVLQNEGVDAVILTSA